MSDTIGQWLRPPIEVATADIFCELTQEFEGNLRVIHVEKQNISRLIEALKKWEQEQ